MPTGTAWTWNGRDGRLIVGKHRPDKRDALEPDTTSLDLLSKPIGLQTLISLRIQIELEATCICQRHRSSSTTHLLNRSPSKAAAIDWPPFCLCTQLPTPVASWLGLKPNRPCTTSTRPEPVDC